VHICTVDVGDMNLHDLFVRKSPSSPGKSDVTTVHPDARLLNRVAVLEAPGVAFDSNKVSVKMIAVSFSIRELNAELASCFVSLISRSLGHAVAILVGGKRVCASNHLWSHVDFNYLALGKTNLVFEKDFDVVLGISIDLVVNLFVFKVGQDKLIAVRVVQLFVEVNLSEAPNGFLVAPGGFETGVQRLEVHHLRGTLEGVCVGSSDGSKLLSLGRAVSIEHSFLGATSGGKVAERLVLPVGPRAEASIKCIS